MEGLNLWAVLASGLASFFLGGIWYSKLLFCKTWCKESGVTQMKSHKPMTYIIAVIVSLFSALVFAILLGPYPNLLTSTIIGFAIGFFFVGASFMTSYLFAGKSIKLMLIDGGYYVLKFTLIGAIIGFWHA